MPARLILNSMISMTAVMAGLMMVSGPAQAISRIETTGTDCHAIRGALIREGRELVAVFQVATGVGAWIRVSFDGTVPQLPAPQPAPAEGADPEPDFYPDEVWDE